MGLLTGLFGRPSESTASSSTASASSTSSSALIAPSRMESCSSSSSTGIASMSKSSSLTSGSPQSSGPSTWNGSTTDNISSYNNSNNNNSSPNSSSDVDSGPWAPYPKSAQLTPHYAFHPLTHKLAYLERQRSGTTSAEKASLFSFGTHTRKGMRKGGLGTCENEVRVVSSLLCMR